MIYYFFKIYVFTERGSKEFERFLTILGNKIRLKGWDKYRGGLDVKGTKRNFIIIKLNDEKVKFRFRDSINKSSLSLFHLNGMRFIFLKGENYIDLDDVHG